MQKLIFTPKLSFPRHFQCVLFAWLFFVPAVVFALPGINGPAIVCQNSSHTYTATGVPPTATITWQVKGAGAYVNGNDNRDSADVQFGGGVSDTVVLVLLNGAVRDTLRQPVTLQSAPSPVIVQPNGTDLNNCLLANPREKGGPFIGPAGPPTQICYGVCDSSFVEYAVASRPGSRYIWSSTGGSIEITPLHAGDTSQVAVLWGASSGGNSYSLTVTEIDASGCTGSASICVIIIQKPHAVISVGHGTIMSQDTIYTCLNSSVSFFSDSSTGDATMAQWIFGDNNSVSVVQNPTHQFSIAGTYTVTLVTSNCSCADTARVIVVVNPLPGFTITCPSTLCPDDTSHYTVNDSCAAVAPIWNVTGGSILNQSKDSATIIWGNGNNGPGSLSYTASCAGYCPYPTVVSIPIVPMHAKITGPNPVCALSGRVQYTVPLVPSTIYTWSMISGSAGSGIDSPPYPSAHGNVVTVQIGGPGTIHLHVIYYNPFLQCGGSADTIINILPSLDFAYTPDICTGQKDSFYTQFPVTPVLWCIIADSTGDTTCIPGASVSMVHTFTQAGAYTITAVDPTGSFCNSPQHQIIVNPNPSPPSVTGITPVCPGNTYTYTSTAIPGSYTAWVVVGGTVNGTDTTAQGNTISVTWNAMGPYILKVQSISVSAPYCSSGVAYDIVPVVVVPVVKITGPGTVCEDADNILYTGTSGGFTYNWNIVSGPASIVNQQDSGCHVIFYHTSGTVILQLTYQLCSYTIIVFDTIQVVSAPAITLTASTPQCINTPITFTATGGGTSYNWNFGNGNTSATGTNNFALEAYQSTGTFTVMVVATGINSCLGQSTASVLVNINPLPTATITSAGTLTLCAPDSTFSDTLTAHFTEPGGSYTFAWSNGSTTNPVIVTSPGAYYVVITDTDGCSGMSNIIDLIVHSCPGCPAPVSTDINLSRNCNSITVMPVLASNCFFISWDFGDNTESTTAITTHTYANAGTYQITLYAGEIIAGPEPPDTCYFSYDTIELIPMVAQFTDTIGCFGGSALEVKFTNTTQVAGTSISTTTWVVNSLTIGTGLVYTTPLSPGTDTVILWSHDALGDYCSDTSLLTMPVQPNANFTFSYNPACINTPVTIIPTWTNPQQIASFLWDFGDGTYSANDTTVKQFTVYPPLPPHQQAVTLTIHDIYGCVDSVTEELTLELNTLNGNITPATASGCLGDSVQLGFFPLSGSTVPVSYVWAINGDDTVGTGNPYYAYQSGTYTVTVTDMFGCVFSPHQTAVIQLQSLPTPVISGALSYCQGQTPVFNAFVPAGLKYTWAYQSNFSSVGLTEGTGANVPTGVAFDTGSAYFYYWDTYASSYATWLDISLTFTDSATGCHISTGPDTAYIHPVPYIDSLGDYGICATGRAQLVSVGIGSFPDSVIFVWSTGQVGSTIPLLNGGIYGVTVTSIYGCSSSFDAFQVYPEPDFSQLISGCYSRCDSATLYGPSGYTNYQWLRNDTAFSASDSTVTVVLSGTYQLAMSTLHGCRDTSPPIYVDIYDCDTTPCCCFDYPTLINDSIVCQGHDSAGNALFNMTAIIWYPGPVSNLTLNADLWGTFTTQSIINLGVTNYGQAYAFNGIYAAPPGHLNFVILKWMIKDSCHVLATHVLPPPCDTLPCCTHINFISDSIYCDGMDSSGNAEYRFTSTIFYEGPATNLKLTGRYGTVTHVTLISSYVDPYLGQAYTFSGIYHTDQSAPGYIMVYFVINDSCQTNPIGHQLPPGCDTGSGNIHGVVVPCVSCLEVIDPAGSGILHKWEVQFNYSGASGSQINLSLSHGTILYTVHHYVTTGINTLGVYVPLSITDPAPYDTLTISIVDLLTKDTSTVMIPLTLACDSSMPIGDSLHLYNVPTCLPAAFYTAQVISTTCSRYGQPGPPNSAYTIITAFNNFTPDSFLTSVVACVPCRTLNDLNGTRNCGPGTSYDTLFVIPDSGATTICLSYLATDSCTMCSITVCDSLPMPCDSGICSISAANVPCTQCLYLANNNPPPGQIMHIWELSYYYTGANGSSATITGTPGNPQIVLNRTVYFGSNQADVYLLIPADLGPTFAYDTLTMTVVDALTGDTCVQKFYAPMDCNIIDTIGDSLNNTHLTACEPSQTAMSIYSISCDLNDGYGYNGIGTPLYTVVVAIDNLTGDSVIGGSIGCNECSSLQNNGHDGPVVYAPGVTYDTVIIGLDTSVHNFCIVYATAGDCRICSMTACGTVNTPCHYCAIDSIWQGPRGCWAYCVYDTVNHYRYQVVDVSFLYNGDTTASISNVFDGNQVTILQPQIVSPGVNELEAIVTLTNPSINTDSTLYRIIDKFGDTCYLSWWTNFSCDTITPQFYPQCAFIDTIDSITCMPRMAGEATYSFTLHINNPTPDTIAIMVYTGTNVVGTVGFNTYLLYPGPNTIIGQASVIDTSVAVSFGVYFLMPCNFCSQTFTFTPPHCPGSLFEMRLDIVPNPSTDKALISYSIDGISSADIILIDALGNHLAQFDNVSSSSTLELNTGMYQPGVYIVAVVWKKNMLIAQKLVILK